MKAVFYLVLVIVVTGCARDRFAVTSDAGRFQERHRFVADVTCTSAQPRFYQTFGDQFHMLAMPPRVRWTVTFRVDKVIKGDLTTNVFQLHDARNRATPYSMLGGFYFQTNMSYTVGFRQIVDGEVRGLEILTNWEEVLPEPHGSKPPTAF